MSRRGRPGPSAIEGTIEVRGLLAHPYAVDVWARADVTDAVATDELAYATDIGLVASSARASIASRPSSAVEALASAVARTLLERFGRIAEARVRVTALEGDHATAEIVIHR